jgi:hypothetical protein
LVGKSFTDIGERFAGSSEKPTDIGRFFSRQVQKPTDIGKKEAEKFHRNFSASFSFGQI